MLHCAAFHVGLPCLQKNLFRGCQSTNGQVLKTSLFLEANILLFFLKNKIQFRINPLLYGLFVATNKHFVFPSMVARCSSCEVTF